jgi:AraC family transcriptional regulator of adaptative response/methylated-DNA-[protein]-cysteine methyltransferase
VKYLLRICEFESKNRSFSRKGPCYRPTMSKKAAEPRTAGKYASVNDRWRAVINRDGAADGAFYYSVSTTGVYCRPACPARRPARQNVAFHGSCEAAEAAGFRPCKRCRPNGPSQSELHRKMVVAACRTIEAADVAPSLDALAKAALMGRYHFHRVFKENTGLTPKAYATAQRAAQVRRHLPVRKTVTDAIYSAGFNSNGRFYAEATQLLGMNPKRFRRGGMGEIIRFAVGECSLGAILVASSEKGVCAIALGDDPDRLVVGLQNQFPNAQLIGGDSAFESVVARVVGFVDSPRIGLDLPLDIRGTAFQQRVWQAMRQVPSGATVTYAELARRIGAARSVRAVASACASNIIAVAIPCHRVVRTDGALSGYRWHVKRKRALLEKERMPLLGRS